MTSSPVSFEGLKALCRAGVFGGVGGPEDVGDGADDIGSHPL
jgi:hypothetical protein